LWRENIGRSIKPLGVNDALYFAGSEFIRGKIRERTYWDGIVGRLGGVHDKEGLLDKYTPKKK